jgi:O-antigen ligase
VANLTLLPAERSLFGRMVDAGGLIRSLLLAAVFLLLWISFQPFRNSGDTPELTEAGNLANQIGYSLVFLLLAAWCLAHQPRRLLLLIRPILITTLLWFALCVLTSWDPALSARRLAFTLVSMGIAAMALLLPKNVRHFGAVIATVVFIVLAVCYLSIFLAPTLAIHQAPDLLEGELAGDWHGVFVQKNEAGAAMAAFVFIGLFVARMRSVALGALIVVLAATFLIFTQSKTSIAVLPATLIVSTVLARIRRPALGVILALALVVVLNLFSIGSIYFTPVRQIVSELLSDPSFTGRTEIWQFAAEHLAQRPITGYGFAAFWGTPQVVYGMAENYVWANTASHAHNAYLDVALAIGIPGSVLVTLWLVVLPLFDFYRSPRDPQIAPLKMLFMRVCLFSAYASCFESMLIEGGVVELFLFMAAFGLRFLSVSRPSR